MFARLGRMVVHHPWRVIGAWVVLAFVIGGFAPRLTDITNSDQTSFLPSSYESVQAMELAERAFPGDEAETAIMVFQRRDGAPLSAADETAVTGVVTALDQERIERLARITTSKEGVAPNRSVQLATVVLDGTSQDEAVLDAVKTLRERAAERLDGTALQVGVTGGAAILLDNQEAFTDAEVIVGIGTIVIIILLLLVIFRSPVAALLPVLAVGLVFGLSTSLIAIAGKAFDFQVGQELGSLLTVVMFGIGTDYILFLLFRYRERLRAGDDPKTAMVVSVERVGEAITSAAAAVIIAFSALALSTFGAFTTLGPGLAIAVATMLVAGLTLVPAIVSLLGTRVFWPSKAWRKTPKGALGARAGGLVARRPALTAAVSGGLLVLLAVGALFFKANYDQISQLPQGTESTEAFADLQEGFPAGALNPTQVYVHSTDGSPVPQATVTAVAAAVEQVDGVGSLLPLRPSQDGTAVSIGVLLTDSPFSNEALDVVSGPLRDAAHGAAGDDAEVLVGGQTSAFADVRSATDRDLKVIFPVAGVLIALVLGLLLRSIVAPLYLIVAVVLSFAATLGATVYVFQNLGGEDAGLMFSLPIILYLFVVAIGTDYNILMVARLREEAREGHEPRRAAALAIEHAGPAVAAAAVILAGTFASLMLARVSLLTQMGFAVAVGILLSAFVMSLFLVPALTSLVGRKAWWPGNADADPAAPGAERELAGARD
jgi:putative drug exporter of the RND superfamily